MVALHFMSIFSQNVALYGATWQLLAGPHHPHLFSFQKLIELKFDALTLS